MSINAYDARARSIERRIRSGRVEHGPFSAPGLMRADHIAAAANVISSCHPNGLTDEELQRAILQYQSSHPERFLTIAEQQAATRKARIDAQNLTTTVKDIDRRVLEGLSALEKLEFANEDGKLPPRIVVKRL